MAHLIALLLGLLATSAAAARSRRMLLSKYSSSTHTSSGNSRLDMMKAQKHPRPWWDTTSFTANPNPKKGPNKKDLLVLADYMTAEGEYLGGHIPTLLYDGPETETSKCDQYYTVNTATRVLLTEKPAAGVNTTDLFCAAWSLDEISFDEKETGSCICKSVAPLDDPKYCSTWECSQTEQDNTPTCVTHRSSRSRYYSSYGSSYSSYYGSDNSGSSYSSSYSHCYRRYEEETSEYKCTEASTSGNFCSKWHGLELSGHTVEDERYVCLEADAAENYCIYSVGETASTEEAEQSESRCITASANGLFCEHYSGTELGLSRYRNRTDAWLIAVLGGAAGGIAGLVWLSIGIGVYVSVGNALCSVLCMTDMGFVTGLAMFFSGTMLFTMLVTCPIILIVGMIVMAVVVAGTTPMLVLMAILAVVSLPISAVLVCFIVIKCKYANDDEDCENCDSSCETCKEKLDCIFCCRESEWDDSGCEKLAETLRRCCTRDRSNTTRSATQRSHSIQLSSVSTGNSQSPAKKMGLVVGTKVRVTGGVHANEFAVLYDDDGSSCPQFTLSNGDQLFMSLEIVTPDLSESSKLSTTGKSPAQKLGLVVGSRVSILRGANKGKSASLFVDDGSNYPQFLLLDDGSKHYISLDSISTVVAAANNPLKSAYTGEDTDENEKAAAVGSNIPLATPVIVTSTEHTVVAAATATATIATAVVAIDVVADHERRTSIIAGATAKAILPILIPLDLAHNAAKLLAHGFKTPSDLERATLDDLIDCDLLRADAMKLVASFVVVEAVIEDSGGSEWACDACTCTNPASATVCTVCGEAQ